MSIFLQTLEGWDIQFLYMGLYTWAHIHTNIKLYDCIYYESLSKDVLDAGCPEVELGDHGVGRVVPGSRSSGRGLVGGGGAVLGDDGLLAGGDAEVGGAPRTPCARAPPWPLRL